MREGRRRGGGDENDREGTVRESERVLVMMLKGL